MSDDDYPYSLSKLIVRTIARILQVETLPQKNLLLCREPAAQRGLAKQGY